MIEETAIELNSLGANTVDNNIYDEVDEIFDESRMELIRFCKHNNKSKDYDTNPLGHDFPNYNQMKEKSKFSKYISDHNFDTRKSITSEMMDFPKNIQSKGDNYFNSEFSYLCGLQQYLNSSPKYAQINIARKKLQWLLHSLPFHIFITILVLVDVIIVVFEIIVETDLISQCRNNEDCDKLNACVDGIIVSRNYTCAYHGLIKVCLKVIDHSQTRDIGRYFNIASVCILSVFMFEIIAKCIAFGPMILKKYFEVFDALIVITSFVIDVAHLSIGENAQKIAIFELLIAIRLWRVFRIITGIIAKFNTYKEEKIKKQITNILSGEAENFSDLMDEYLFAKLEILRLREKVIRRKVSPFPKIYWISKIEAKALGFTI